MTNNLKVQMNELQEKMDILKKEFVEKGKKLFNEQVKNIFDIYPTLQSFSWTQYTPYFNDGDTCYFSVYADYPKIMLVDMDEPIDLDDCDLDEDSEEYKQTDTMRSSISSLIFSIDETILQNLFGDHVEITINRDGNIIIDEYDHE